MSNGKKHAVLSPSSSSRWFRCPGSVKAAEGVPDPETPYAREGTFAHDIAAHCLNGNVDAASMIGTVRDEFTVDEAFAAHVQEYLDYVRALPGKVLGVEVEVKVAHLPDVWGTADYVKLDEDEWTLHVADLKFGAGIYVEVEDNSQQMIYAIGVVDTLLTKKLLTRVKKVRLHVIQPRHHLAAAGPSSWEIDLGGLRDWGMTTLVRAVEATKMPEPWLSAGDWCQFCRVKVTCPQLKKQALQVAQGVFKDEGEMLPAALPPDPAKLTNDQLAVALRGFPLLEKWIHAVREHAYERCANGTVTIPGFKLVQTVGHRQWIDPEAARELLEMFLPKDASIMTEPIPPKLLSPAQAEKKLKKSDRHLLEQLTQKPTGGTVLVPESDPRPAVASAEVFPIEGAKPDEATDQP